MKKSIKELNVSKSQILNPSHLSKLKGGGVIIVTAISDSEGD